MAQKVYCDGFLTCQCDAFLSIQVLDILKVSRACAAVKLLMYVARNGKAIGKDDGAHSAGVFLQTGVIDHIFRAGFSGDYDQ
jgi:hypothetical protein